MTSFSGRSCDNLLASLPSHRLYVAFLLTLGEERRDGIRGEARQPGQVLISVRLATELQSTGAPSLISLFVSDGESHSRMLMLSDRTLTRRYSPDNCHVSAPQSAIASRAKRRDFLLLIVALQRPAHPPSLLLFLSFLFVCLRSLAP